MLVAVVGRPFVCITPAYSAPSSTRSDPWSTSGSWPRQRAYIPHFLQTTFWTHTKHFVMKCPYSQSYKGSYLFLYTCLPIFIFSYAPAAAQFLTYTAGR